MGFDANEVFFENRHKGKRLCYGYITIFKKIIKVERFWIFASITSIDSRFFCRYNAD